MPKMFEARSKFNNYSERAEKGRTNRNIVIKGVIWWESITG